MLRVRFSATPRLPVLACGWVVQAPSWRWTGLTVAWREELSDYVVQRRSGSHFLGIVAPYASGVIGDGAGGVSALIGVMRTQAGMEAISARLHVLLQGH